MFTDDDRRRLYDALEHTLGHDPASILMAHLPPVGWAELATKGDLVGVRGEIAEVRGEIAEVRGEIAEVRGEIAEVRGEVSEVRGEVSEVRGEVSELRGEIKAMLPRLITANIASMIGVAGLVLAASSLG
jgi:septal ring factor EnvC (AmiA/AmiB activator)